MKIEVIEMSDYADCEQCGGNYADGGVVKIDGEVVLDFTPTAACFGNKDVSLSGLLIKTLEHLGHTVEVAYEGVSDGFGEYVYEGQSVGFTYKGAKFIGKVLDVKPEYVVGDLVYLATVKTDVQDFEINVERLLGVVK